MAEALKVMNETNITAEDVSGEAMCSHVLQKQVDLLRDLAEASNSLKDKVADMELKSNSESNVIRELRSQLHTIEERMGSSTSSGTAAYSEAVQWYGSMVSTIQSLTGIEVHPSHEQRTLTIRMTPENVELVVTYKEDFSRFINIGVSGEARNFSDILTAALSSQSIAFLVREVRMRARNNLLRKETIRSVTQKYASSWDGSSPDVTLTLDMGIVCKLYISMDFPAPGSQVVFDALENVAGWDQDQLDDVCVSLNEAKIENLTQAIAELEGKLSSLRQ